MYSKQENFALIQSAGLKAVGHAYYLGKQEYLPRTQEWGVRSGSSCLQHMLAGVFSPHQGSKATCKSSCLLPRQSEYLASTQE
jgi:hypothetical protein